MCNWARLYTAMLGHAQPGVILCEPVQHLGHPWCGITTDVWCCWGWNRCFGLRRSVKYDLQSEPLFHSVFIHVNICYWLEVDLLLLFTGMWLCYLSSFPRAWGMSPSIFHYILQYLTTTFRQIAYSNKSPFPRDWVYIEQYLQRPTVLLPVMSSMAFWYCSANSSMLKVKFHCTFTLWGIFFSVSFSFVRV